MATNISACARWRPGHRSLDPPLNGGRPRRLAATQADAANACARRSMSDPVRQTSGSMNCLPAILPCGSSPIVRRHNHAMSQPQTVEKDRSTLRGVKPAEFSHQDALKVAPLVPEQLALQQAGWN
jgi:hypothetical protein